MYLYITKYSYVISFNRFIWPIDEILTDTTTPGQNVRGSNGNEEVLYTFQITIRYCLVSYPEHLFC